jgi:hypothetical protein
MRLWQEFSMPLSTLVVIVAIPFVFGPLQERLANESFTDLC